MKVKNLYLIILVLVMIHLPFLDADPDKQADLHTRGAWTDEGLYASQLRNFLNYGEFGITENTTFVRGPVYDFIRLPFFWVFGQSLWLARLLTLAGVVVTLLLLARKKEYRLFTLFVIVLGFLQFRLFHFSHYAMAEMLAVSAVIISFVCFDDYMKKGKRKYLFFATLMIAAAWGLKIQFLYLVVLIPGVTILWFLFGAFKGEVSFSHFFREGTLAVIFAAIFPSIYLIIWYLPNKDFYDQIMFEQTTRRFGLWPKLYGTIDFNFSGLITDPQNLMLLIGFVFAIIVLIRSLEKENMKLKNPTVIIFGTVWLLLELHKLGMTYLPQRYLLSLYAAVAFFSGAVLSQFFAQNRMNRFWLALFLVISVGVYGVSIYQSYFRRTFVLRAVNAYVKNFDWDGKTMAGVWAPAISWSTDAKVIPVWRGYNDPVRFFETDKPDMIVEEPNEETSESFFRDNGYNLLLISDSVRAFKLWRYDVNLYWIEASSENLPSK